jgi:Tfp pilus assembly protein PilF
LALLPAVIFAVHPVNTIVVSYIFNRSCALEVFFYLAAFYLFINAAENKKSVLILSVFSYILALMSRQNAITLPAVLIMAELLGFTGTAGKKYSGRFKRHAWFWAVLTAYVLLRVVYFGSAGDVESAGSISPGSYIMTQPYVILRYFEILIMPLRTSIDHNIDPVESILNIRFIIPVAVFLIIISAVLFAFRKDRNTARMNIFCAGWFLITLIPTSSIVPTTTYMADNRLYLSGLAFFMFLGLVVLRTGLHIKPKRMQSLVVKLVISLYILLLCIFTLARNYKFLYPARLWEEVLKMYPDNFRAYNNLGLQYYMNGEYDKAVNAFENALNIRPESANSLASIGLVYYRMADYSRALEVFNMATKIDPGFFNAYNHRGSTYYILGKYHKAISDFRTAISLNNNVASTHNNLGSALRAVGNYPGAMKEFKKAIELDPGYFKAHLNAGKLLAKTGKIYEAMKELKIAARLDPHNGRIQKLIDKLESGIR